METKAQHIFTYFWGGGVFVYFHIRCLEIFNTYKEMSHTKLVRNCLYPPRHILFGYQTVNLVSGLRIKRIKKNAHNEN